MDSLSTFSSLADVLHALAQALLVPDIVLLILFAGYALFCIGSILMEYVTERRNFKVAMPKFLSDLMSAEEREIPETIRSSQLLNRQKSALLTVYDYRTLPGDALLALIRRTVHDEETHYARITGRNNTAAKISPMLGLMGTLIPLGPGVAALGQGDTLQLSNSLLVAFDTTVAGLAVAAVCMAVGKIRSNWYNDYLSALDSGMATLLQKIDDLREAGKLEARQPTNYAFMFEKGLEKAKQGSAVEDQECKGDESDPAKPAEAGALQPSASNEARAVAPVSGADRTALPGADRPAFSAEARTGASGPSHAAAVNAGSTATPDVPASAAGAARTATPGVARPTTASTIAAPRPVSEPASITADRPSVQPAQQAAAASRPATSGAKHSLKDWLSGSPYSQRSAQDTPAVAPARDASAGAASGSEAQTAPAQSAPAATPARDASEAFRPNSDGQV